MSDTPRAPRSGHPHVRRIFLGVASTVSAIVFLVSAFGMGSYFWARSKIIEFHITGDKTGKTGAVEFSYPCSRHPCNYLLLGSDSRKGLTQAEIDAYGSNAHNGGFRSDVIIVVHTDPRTSKAVILHFPRDLWVNIPGIGWGKINSAFSLGLQHGGPEKVAQTVKSISGLQINHIMFVDLAGFQGVVDALHGVPMCVDRPMYDQLAGLNIPKAGCYDFNGKTALAYVRARHLPGDCIPDFARIGRQQQFLRAVLNKMLSTGEILHLASIIPAILKNIYVDPGLRDLTELKYLADNLHGINTGAADFRVVPTTPKSIYPNGVFTSVVTMVQPEADQLFKDIRQNKPLGNLGVEQQDTPPSPADIKVAVFDNGNASGADRVETVLQESGFDVSLGVQPITALGHAVSGSALYYRAADANMADVAQGFIPNLQEKSVKKSWLTGYDLAVVVGPGFVPQPPGGAPPPSC
jgi:LCP family protein required for cell wall assembly